MPEPRQVLDVSEWSAEVTDEATLRPLVVRVPRGHPPQVIHTRWPSPPEPGLVESLQLACRTHAA